MEKLFLSILNMSLTASYVILVVLLVRLPLKKAPKTISYALWSVVVFRLLYPFSFESIFSLLPKRDITVPNDIIYTQSPMLSSEITALNSYVTKTSTSPPVFSGADPLQIYIRLGSYIWILGIIIMFVYSISSIMVLKRRLDSAQHIELNVFEADDLRTPFILGIFRPRIYIPSGLGTEERIYIINHEQAHIQRFDHVIKPFAFFILSIHWFNPLVWIAFLLASTDMELSCDEKVIKKMGSEIKKAYSSSLLSLAVGRHILNGSPLAFGEGDVKSRIKNVLNYRKPSFWVVIPVIIAILVSIGLLANPRKNVPATNETMSFKSKETDLVKLGTTAFNEYMSTLTAERTPVNERIASCKLNDISLLAGDINEFCVSLNYDFTTDNDNYVNPSLAAKGKGKWPDNYMEIRVKNIGKYTYEIVGIGTGGGGQGLSSVKDSVSYSPTDLEACISNAILTSSTNNYRKGDFAAEAHTVFKTVVKENITTVYAMALYMEFGFAGSGFFETGGSHMPVAITFERKTTGEYVLKEYWIPQDGSYYSSSIKKKFPIDIYGDAIDTQKYILAHTQACYAQAIEYGNVPVTGHLGKLLETICSSPAAASNPGAYIDAHPIEYREMLYYGSYTLRYCFTLFEKGGQTGLEGHIMASACRDILGTVDIDVLASTGQDWYDAFKESAEDLLSQKGEDYMKKNRPGSWILLQMLKEANN